MKRKYMMILGFDKARMPSPSAQGAIPILVLLVLVMMLAPLPAFLLDAPSNSKALLT
jgi:flagellar biosynthesis protein FlhA